MARRVTPTTKPGMHTYTVEGEEHCPNCSGIIPDGRKSCRHCGVMRYWVEHEQDGGADFTVCDPKCMKLRPTSYIDHECNGIHDPATPSCPDLVPVEGQSRRYVERCGQLESATGFSDDEAAALAFGLEGTWVTCAHGGNHYLVEEV